MLRIGRAAHVVLTNLRVAPSARYFVFLRRGAESRLQRHLVYLAVVWLVERSQDATDAISAVLVIGSDPGVAIFAPLCRERILDYVVFEPVLGSTQTDDQDCVVHPSLGSRGRALLRLDDAFVVVAEYSIASTNRGNNWTVFKSAV